MGETVDPLRSSAQLLLWGLDFGRVCADLGFKV